MSHDRNVRSNNEDNGGAGTMVLCLRFGLALAGTPAVTPGAAAPPVQVNVNLPSTSTGTLAVRIFAPATPAETRYADGAPVPVFALGGTDAGTLRPALWRSCLCYPSPMCAGYCVLPCRYPNCRRKRRLI